jgi:RNA polymerase sigma-70 factor (ECF subfamily)
MEQAPGAPTADLVAAAQGGDAQAYEQLFERVADRLLLFIRLRMGPRLREHHDPLDVLQETYVEAHRSFARFRPDGPGAFTRWLHAVADHRLRDLAKEQARQKRRPPSPLVHGSGVMDRVRARHTGPSSACARREAQEKLAQAMLELAEEEREALLRRYFQEETLETIAAALGRSEPTVRRLLGHARVKLGKLLGSL